MSDDLGDRIIEPKKIWSDLHIRTAFANAFIFEIENIKLQLQIEPNRKQP